MAFSGIQATLYGLAGNALKALSSFIGGIAGSNIAQFANGLLQGTGEISDADNILLNALHDVGLFKRLVLKGVASALGIIIGAVDIFFGLQKLVEGAQTGDQQLRNVRIAIGSLQTAVGVLGVVSGVGALSGMGMGLALMGIALTTGLGILIHNLENQEENYLSRHPGLA